MTVFSWVPHFHFCSSNVLTSLQTFDLPTLQPVPFQLTYLNFLQMEFFFLGLLWLLSSTLRQIQGLIKPTLLPTYPYPPFYHLIQQLRYWMLCRKVSLPQYRTLHRYCQLTPCQCWSTRTMANNQITINCNIEIRCLNHFWYLGTSAWRRTLQDNFLFLDLLIVLTTGSADNWACDGSKAIVAQSKAEY